MGLPVDLYFNPRYRRCANGGVTEYTDRFVVVNIDGPFEPQFSAEALLLVHGNLNGHAKLVPAVNVGSEDRPRWIPLRPEGMVGPMMGGSYAGTSDGRFREAVQALTGHPSGGVLPVHDRWETPEQYDQMSR